MELYWAEGTQAVRGTCWSGGNSGDQGDLAEDGLTEKIDQKEKNLVEPSQHLTLEGVQQLLQNLQNQCLQNLPGWLNQMG